MLSRPGEGCQALEGLVQGWTGSQRSWPGDRARRRVFSSTRCASRAHFERPDLPLVAFGAGAGARLAAVLPTWGLGVFAPSFAVAFAVLAGWASTLRARPVGQILRRSQRGQSGVPSTQ